MRIFFLKGGKEGEKVFVRGMRFVGWWVEVKRNERIGFWIGCGDDWKCFFFFCIWKGDEMKE